LFSLNPVRIRGQLSPSLRLSRTFINSHTTQPPATNAIKYDHIDFVMSSSPIHLAPIPIALVHAHNIRSRAVVISDAQDELEVVPFLPNVTIPKGTIGGCSAPHSEVCPSATVLLENLSGVGFDAGIAAGSASIGNCVLTIGVQSSGLTFVNSDGSAAGYFGGTGSPMRYIPIGGKIVLTISSSGCNPSLSASKSTDVALSLVVKVADQFFTVPVSASGVAVRASAKP
jgi:hypothetical protein